MRPNHSIHDKAKGKAPAERVSKDIRRATRRHFSAEAADCGKKSDGSGQQAMRKYPESSSGSLTWQAADHAICNSMKDARIRTNLALASHFLEEKRPVSTIEGVLAKAKKEMPWTAVAKPKKPIVQLPKKTRKKR